LQHPHFIIVIIITIITIIIIIIIIISWAHPEFGQILASCSEDRSVHIHEEVQACTITLFS
jgi:hypothetical protein